MLILRLHGEEILRTANRILNDAALAEDAAQETLLQIRDRAGQFKGHADPARADSSARNWIMRIACNTSLHILRTRRRAQHREELNAYKAEPAAIDMDQKDALATLVRAQLADMPEKQRQPLVMHFFGGLSYEEIAAELRCGVGAARVRVHRALEKLRERMAALGLAFSLAALYALLEAPAQAAEAVVSPEKFAKWESLLTASHHAAFNALADGGQVPALAQAGYVAAAAICGALTVASGSFSDSAAIAPEKLMPQAPVSKIERTTSAKNPDIVAAVAPVAPRTVRETDTDTPETKRERKERERKTASRPAGDGLVSPLAQLKLLRMMQHEVNERVAKLHQELNGAEPTETQKDRLARAAEDQAEIAKLIEMLGREMKNE